MAYAANDGKKFGSKFRMSRHNEAHAGKPAGARAEMHAINAGPEEAAGGQADMANGDPGQMAEEHGPANEVNITHDHESGTHHTHIRHADGFEHHKDHASADHAHHHAAMAAGVMSPNPGEDEKEGTDADSYESEPLD
jgi:hypothetical protein